MAGYVLFGPYLLAAVLVLGALIGRNRDLGSTNQFWIMLGGAGLLVIGWTGLVVALA
jgi:hypothetical protein